MEYNLYFDIPVHGNFRIQIEYFEAPYEKKKEGYYTARFNNEKLNNTHNFLYLIFHFFFAFKKQ